MSSTASQACKAELWQAYREAFHEFARRVDELETLKTSDKADLVSVEKALLELERARLEYHESRDALAALLLSERGSALADVLRPVRSSDDNQRVREIAQLLWEFEARRSGFADDDWFRAEGILRSARAAAGQACSASLS